MRRAPSNNFLHFFRFQFDSLWHFTPLSSRHAKQHTHTTVQMLHIQIHKRSECMMCLCVCVQLSLVFMEPSHAHIHVYVQCVVHIHRSHKVIQFLFQLCLHFIPPDLLFAVAIALVLLANIILSSFIAIIMITAINAI